MSRRGSRVLAGVLYQAQLLPSPLLVMTAYQFWTSWSREQREHFLLANEFSIGWRDREWTQLIDVIQDKLEELQHWRPGHAKR